jgi:hypothetical protein
MKKLVVRNTAFGTRLPRPKSWLHVSLLYDIEQLTSTFCFLYLQNGDHSTYITGCYED